VLNYSAPHSAESFYMMCCATWNHESICRCCRQSDTCLIFYYISGPLASYILYLVHKPFCGCLLDPPSDGQSPEGKKENTILLKMCTKGTGFSQDIWYVVERLRALQYARNFLLDTLISHPLGSGSSACDSNSRGILFKFILATLSLDIRIFFPLK